MTDTFDWAGLWIGTANAFKEYRPDRAGPAMEERDQAAASYLRERIEAAFVPVETLKAVLNGGQGAYADVHTRAEAAEARVSELTAQLAEARQAERAAVVAWLRGLHWTHVHNQEALFFAAAIEEGSHLT